MLDNNKTNAEQKMCGTVGAQSANKEMVTVLDSGKEKKTQELYTSFKISRELLQMVINATLMIMKKYNSYSGGMNKDHDNRNFIFCINQTPFRKLLVSDGEGNTDAAYALILKGVADCLQLCVDIKCDKMYSQLFHKNICKCEHIFENDSDLLDFQVVVSDSVSGFTQDNRDRLQKLYPNARDNAERVKRAFSDVIMFSARFTGKFDVHLSSAGSKKTVMRSFHLEALCFSDGTKILVDVFSRSASIPLSCIGVFDEIYCGDNDKRFVNFFKVLRDYPVALVRRIRSIAFEFKNTVLDMGYSEDEQHEHGKKFYKDICTRCDSKLHKAKKETVIDAAACLVYWLRFSYRGFGKEFNLKQAGKFINGIDTVCTDLLYTSAVLVDSSSVPTKHFRILKKPNNTKSLSKAYWNLKLAKFYWWRNSTYKKSINGLAYKAVDKKEKNTISICPISYEYWGFMKAILKYKDNPNAVLILDMPYLRHFLFPCGDYKKEFSLRHVRQMFKLLKGAKCKAILFHSNNDDVKSLTASCGFRLAGTYKTSKDSTEVTYIYSLNISAKEDFFVPDELGKVYRGGASNG